MSFSVLHVLFWILTVLCRWKFENKRSILHTGCGGTITLSQEGRNRIISSPNYPSSYPNNVRQGNCTWTVHAPGSSNITIEFLSFDIEAGGTSCVFDDISIFDGSNTQNRLAKACGTTSRSYVNGQSFRNDTPGPFHSTSSSMFISFKSDASVQKKGFQAKLSIPGKGLTLLWFWCQEFVLYRCV